MRYTFHFVDGPLAGQTRERGIPTLYFDYFQRGMSVMALPLTYRRRGEWVDGHAEFACGWAQ